VFFECLNLENYLKHDKLLDLDGLNLFSELNILNEIYDWKMIN